MELNDSTDRSGMIAGEDYATHGVRKHLISG